MELIIFLSSSLQAIIDTAIQTNPSPDTTPDPNIDSAIVYKAGIGAVGGLILSIYNMLYDSDQLPNVVKTKFLIIHFLLWPAIGFLIPWIYLMDENQMSWFLCFQTGLTGPAILQGLFRNNDSTIDISDEA